MAESSLWDLMKARFTPKVNRNAQELRATAVTNEFLEVVDNNLTSPGDVLTVEIVNQSTLADMLDVMNEEAIASKYEVWQESETLFKVRQRTLI